MGKTKNNPRYHVISFRVSDEEKALITAAERVGMTDETMRNLVLLGARCLSSDPPFPLTRILPSTDQVTA